LEARALLLASAFSRQPSFAKARTARTSRMSLLPQSLFARLLTAMLAVVGVTLVIIVVLIVRERHDIALIGSGGWASATSIVDTSTELAGLTGNARHDAVERFRVEPLTIEVVRPRRPRERPDFSEVEAAFAKRIRRQLGSDFKVAVSRASFDNDDTVIRIMNEMRFDRPNEPDAGAPAGPRSDESRDDRGPPPPGRTGMGRGGRLFDVLVTLPDGDHVTFRTMAPMPGPPLPREIFIQLGVLTLALALVLFLMTRTITRPLSDLARAADAIGRGGRHEPLAERGAKEVRDATRAFNTMHDRLQRYLESRTRVLAAMSHDLRTPLTRLRLRAESIEDASLRESFAADLDEMNEMVRGALNLFKGLTDSETVEPVVVDDMLAALKVEFAELDGEVDITGKSQGPIPARPRALKRCLSNVLHNAVKYGERAHVQIEDGKELLIRVRDEGPGIPPDQLERVFEPFFRVESSRNRDTGGTGLGLSIARDIAQAHGGSVSLSNSDGGGLEVKLTLPRA
jgi:signal transduction histidine kinase